MRVKVRVRVRIRVRVRFRVIGYEWSKARIVKGMNSLETVSIMLDKCNKVGQTNRRKDRQQAVALPFVLAA